MEMQNNRKYYLDNIRWSVVLLVMFYHVLYVYNSVGVITNVAVKGIPQLDIILNFIYPWFMNLMFVVAGVGAWYSLKSRTARQFAKERALRLLIPSVGGMFILGWMNGFVTDQSVHMFAAAPVPGVVRYLVYCMMGIGPLWFLHQLFVASMALLLIRAIDKKGKLYNFFGKINASGKQKADGGKDALDENKENHSLVALLILLLFGFAVWGSSYLFVTPMIKIYRNGIYILMFLLGYYVFSQEHILEILKKYCRPLTAAAVLTGIAYSIFYYGRDYTADACLQHPFTNFYAWLMILAVMGCGQVWVNGHNKVTEFLKDRSFGYYMLHYPILIVSTYVITTCLKLPVICNYVLSLLCMVLFTVLLTEVISRLPVLRFWLLGIRKKKSYIKDK